MLTMVAEKYNEAVKKLEDFREEALREIAQLRSQLGLTDGCGFDAEGNLWVTLVLANKVVAITPAGTVVTMLSDPQGKIMRNPTNVTWGGENMRDLYIGSVTTDYVLKFRSPTPGQPLIHQL